MAIHQQVIRPAKKMAPSLNNCDTPLLSLFYRQQPISNINYILHWENNMISPFALRTPFVSGVQPYKSATCCWWFIFSKSRLLVHLPGHESAAICTKNPEQLGLQPIFTRYLGRYATANCFVAALEDGPPHLQDMGFEDLRSLFGVLDNDIFCIAGRRYR